MYSIESMRMRFPCIQQIHVLVTPVFFIWPLFFSSPAAAEDYFNLNALEAVDGIKNVVNLDSFSKSGAQIPGDYQVDIYINHNHVSTRTVTFVEHKGKLQPKLLMSDLTLMGVKTEAFPKLSEIGNDNFITDLGNYIPGANTALEFSQQRLDVSMPQAALKQDARGFVDPGLWDNGIPALFTNYSFSGANTSYRSSQADTNNYFLSLRSGINIGPWRVRNYSTWNKSQNGSGQWNNINTYLQRDVKSIRSQLVAGDSNTRSEVFDSIPLRGVQLYSDDNMLPESLRGFAPIVRGIAQSNAQVTVRQNGYDIYQTYVAPGAFEITDLYPTASSGNLEVTIKEADGTEKKFIQPFSAAPIMQREGRLKYSVSAGKYRTQYDEARKPEFVMGTLIYGLPKDTTVYGGILGADKYKSSALGAGHGFGDFGSVSLDVTLANAELIDKSEHNGQSYRIQYAKSIVQTGTSVTLAGYRYSTSGFYDFSEANELNFSSDDSWRLRRNKRSKTQFNLNQTLNGWGNVYLSGYQQDYWKTRGYERNVSLGYTVGLAGITYGLNYTWNQMPGGASSDQQVAFSMQIPLSKWLSNSWANYNANSARGRNTTHQLGLSGTALSDNRLSYAVQANRNGSGDSNNGSASVTYKGSKGVANAGYYYYPDSRQINYGLQGSVVAHPYGVTLAQPVGDTFALVRAPDAADVKVKNNTGVYTDWAGNAIIPYLSTYRKNRIALDSETFGEDVEVDSKVETVIPSLGAMVLADFKTRIGTRAFITLTHKGKPVPFGSEVLLEGDEVSDGIAGSGGEVYMSGLPADGKLLVTWGPGSDEKCYAPIKIPQQKKQGIVKVNSTCI